MAEKSEKPKEKPSYEAKAAGAPKGKQQFQPQKQQAMVSKSGKEIRGIVRISGRDLKGNWTLKKAVQSIKGMGQNVGQVIAKAVLKELKLDQSAVVGELDEQQIHSLEQILQNPQKYGVPTFMLNRQREFVGGSAHHLSGTDLAYAVKQDIDHDKDSYTWRGYRHAYGQKVRGQRTRSTGRTGMTVGVLRKAVLAKAGAAAAAQAGTGAQAAAAPVAAQDKGAPKKPAAAAPPPAAKPAEKK